MKKTSILLITLYIGLTAFAQGTKPHWNKILKDKPETFQTQLISSSESSIKVNVQVPGFYTMTVTTPRGEANVITVPKSVSTALAGEPDVPMTGIPLMIGDKARMKARVIEAQHMDFEGIDVAPSKGDFPRTIDPETVPYTYGACYQNDAFFPSSNLDMYEPYIIRDFRGQNLAVYPFAYNPVTKTLRVYYNMTVEMYKVDDKGENIIESRRSNVVKMDPDFKSVYQRHFLNYEESTAKYTPLDEDGDLLIICYDNFISYMTDFVNWKKTRGINTTIVGTSTAGSTYSAIKTYIQNQYNANNNLTHVLLVGDVAQIPGYTYSGGGSDYSGKGDNAYGQIVGNDIYNDVFIGRFSASNATRVTTQANRVIAYERDLTTSATWLQKGQGISRKEDGNGHNGEDDYEHINNIRTDLLNYGYTSVTQRYANLTGYDGSSSTISSDINSGVGIINYANHGQETAWGANYSGYVYYSNSHVNALTNNNKLPFIFSVACLVGKYDHNSDCFAEAWMNATNGSNPTGAVGTLMSYIEQPWIPPMWAQDECIDILCELKSNNIKHTWGGTSINGLMGIFDHYGTSTAQAVGTYQAWILFGDPSMMLRTKTPQAMTIAHNGTIDVTQTTYTVSVSNGNGALATITDANHNILGKATVSNGTANINISGTLNGGDQLTLCVFGYNKVTYLGTIEVVAGEQYTINVNADPTEGGTVTGAGDYYENFECTLTATANRGYAFVGWKLNGAIVSTEANYTFTVTGNATYTACFDALTAHTIEAMTVEHGTISFSPATAYPGETVTLTATPENGYILRAWLVYKTGDMSSSVTVNGNEFVMPDYDVTIAALFVIPTGSDVTIGSGNTSSTYLPTWACYNYSLSQQIYTAEELGTAGTITAIAFKNSTNTATRTFDIYLKHTSKAVFSSTTDWVTMSASDKVFTGTVSYPTSGWFTIYLDTPFTYDGTSNVILCVDDNSNTYIEAFASAPKCYTYSTGGNRSLRIHKDEIDFDPTTATALSSYTGNLLASNNQIQVTMASPSGEATINLTPEALEGFSYNVGEGPSAAQAITLLASTSEDLSIIAPQHFEISLDEQGVFTGTITIPAAPVISETLYVRLKDGINAGNYNGELLQFQSGETVKTVSLSGEVIQTNHFIYNENLYAANMSVFAVIVIDGVEQRVESLEAGAFCGDECRGSERPLYCPPVDRYILPFIIFGENDDPITFRLYDHEQEMELELNCLTTISFTEQGAGTITSPIVLVFTSGTTPVTMEQTITFDIGWNWFSCYLESDNALKETIKNAVAESNSTSLIKDMNGSIMLQNGHWHDNGFNLSNESMYMIYLNEPVTVTFEAEPADPADHPITLTPGWNWIGFLSAEPMSIAEALSGLTPNNGDLIKNMDGSASYTGNWQGSLKNLVPGEGYMYYNNGSETITFTFPVVRK